MTAAGRLPRTWIIWLGALLTAAMVALVSAWWLLPRWAPGLVVAHSPWPEPALRAWRLSGASGGLRLELQQALEARLLEWGPAIGSALRQEFDHGDEQCRLHVMGLASEVARADGIAAGTTLPEERRASFSAADIAQLREELVQLVLAAMAEGSHYLPGNASYVAMPLRDDRTVPPMCAFLATQKPPVFEGLEPVVRFLGAMRDPRAVPVLIPLLPIRHRAHPTVEEALAACLAESSVGHVVAATRHDHEAIRAWAARCLPRFTGSPALAQRVVALIADPEPQVAMAAIVSAVRCVPEAAAPALLRLAETSTNEGPLVLAITSLGELSHAPARDFLREQVRTRTGSIRTHAVTALGRIGDARDVDLLLPLLTRPEMAKEALSALERMPLNEAQRRQVDAARASTASPP